MGIDLYLYVEVFREGEWVRVCRMSTPCKQCEGTGVDQEEEEDEDEEEETSCWICLGTKIEDAVPDYVGRNYVLYALFGYDGILEGSYSPNRGFPPKSHMVDNSSVHGYDDNTQFWSYVSGTEFLKGPPCGWDGKMTIDNTVITCHDAIVPLIKSGFVDWISELNALYGGDNLRISWYFA